MYVDWLSDLINSVGPIVCSVAMVVVIVCTIIQLARPEKESNEEDSR